MTVKFERLKESNQFNFFLVPEYAKRILTHKRKPCLLVGSHTYFLNNRHNDKTYWICSTNRKTRCAARLVTLDEKGKDKIIKRKEIHNHQPDIKKEL